MQLDERMYIGGKPGDTAPKRGVRMSEGKRAHLNMTLQPRVKIETIPQVRLDSMIALMDLPSLNCGPKVRALSIYKQDAENWVEVSSSQADETPVLQVSDPLCSAVEVKTSVDIGNNSSKPINGDGQGPASERPPIQAVAPQPVSEPPSLTELAQKWGIRSPGRLARRVTELGSGNELIEGLITRPSLNVVIGASGLGKSPLMYQLGICVASGRPFMGREVAQGRVLMVDYENGLKDSLDLTNTISRFLGLSEPPEEFLIASVNDRPANWTANGGLTQMIKDAGPVLTIIDPLSAAYPTGEEKNSLATSDAQALRAVMNKNQGALISVHHTRKASPDPSEHIRLTNENLREWFQQARGASAIINTADTRLGVDRPARSMEADIVLAGYQRVRGEIAAMYLERVCDPDHGTPQGYRPLVGKHLLPEKERAVYDSLSDEFTFSEAKRAYGKADQSTRDMVRRWQTLRIAEQPEPRGTYRKIQPSAEQGRVADPVDVDDEENKRV